MATVETVGSYRLGRTLGRGSYGKVKLGVHEASGKQVAVKIVAHTNEKSKRQLEREISIISKLQHPNVVQMHEVLRFDDRIYIILEYVGGGELFDYIMGRGRISEKMAVKFFRQMVSAVGYCHKNGVCHRDLKPENLILDEEGNIKINDFGLSNFFAHDTLLNSFCGSPIYAAPEIMAEKIYNGPSADVWSLGIVLYAMVVGQLPWKLDERGIICDVDDLIRARFTIPSSATISPECEDLIRRILVADPLSRIKLDDLARHPWIMKGFGYPVNFNGEGSPGTLKISKNPSTPRKRATIAVMDRFDPAAAADPFSDAKEQRRGSAPENFFTKLFHRVSPRDKAASKEPQIRSVRGPFQLDITTTKPPDYIMQEINKALHQSKIEQSNEGFVYHCTGKVNVKGKGDEPVTSYKIKFDIELCNVAGIQGLYGLHFKKINGSVWLFRSLSIYLIDRMKL